MDITTWKKAAAAIALLGTVSVAACGTGNNAEADGSDGVTAETSDALNYMPYRRIIRDHTGLTFEAHEHCCSETTNCRASSRGELLIVCACLTHQAEAVYDHCVQLLRDEADTSTPDGDGGGEDPSDDSPDIPEL